MRSSFTTMEIFDRRFDEDEFLAQRGAVLAGWPTGREVDLDDAVAYHRSLSDHKVQPKRLARVKAEGGIMLLPMLGQARMETMQEIIRFCEDECGFTEWSDSWFLLLDAYSRKNRCADTQRDRGQRQGRPQHAEWLSGRQPRRARVPQTGRRFGAFVPPVAVG